MTNRLLSLLEVSLASTAIFLYVWRGRFSASPLFWIGATDLFVCGVLVFSFYFHRDTPAKVGLRVDNVNRALRNSLPWLLAAILCVTALALWRRAEIRVEHARDIWLYFPWGLAQQYFLQAFLRPRMKDAAGRRFGGLLAASIFALLHLPNLWLVAAAWIGAAVSIFLFEQVANVWVLGAEHALVAITLLLFFKYSLLGQFAIGPPLQKYTLSGAGIRLVACDLDGDGRAELIVVPAATPAAGAVLKIFKQDRLWKSVVLFPESTGGLEIAAGVLDERASTALAQESINPQSAIHNPQSEQSAIHNPQSAPPTILVARGPMAGNSDELLLLSPDLKIIRKFPARAVTYGASVAVAAGRVVCSPGPSPWGRPSVEVRDAYGKIMAAFALNDSSIANGARVTQGIIDPQGANILVTPQPLSTNPAICFMYDLRGDLVRRFSPYKGLTYGMNCAVAHWDGRAFLVFTPGPGPGYRTDLRIFSIEGTQVGAFEGGFSSFAASVAAGDWDGDGQDEIFLGAGINPNGDYRVRVLDRNGKLLREWSAF
ncbi:MAG TPA: hypothetical protein VGQ81_06030 [Acidobacteriota bacterium]|jgi:hypothetical protein|nr:hypothetical protein [Acidobacteriota bacterium]